MCGGRGRLWPRGLYSGYVQAMEPKPVDERDTRWEADKAPLRIFIHSPGHTVGAYDTECSLAAAEAWATTHDEAVGYHVALRVDDARDGKGLIWLIDRAPTEGAQLGRERKSEG